MPAKKQTSDVQTEAGNITSNKKKILDAASLLFLQGGVSALSVRAIAAKAGVSTIGIYSHYNGKDGLLETLYIEGFSMVSDAMTVDDPSDPRAAILMGCRRYLDIAHNHQAHYQLIFGDAGADYQPSDIARAASIKAFGKLLSFASIILPKNADQQSRQKKALEIWAVLHGFVSLKRHNVGQMLPDMDWDEVIIDSVKKLIIDPSPV